MTILVTLFTLLLLLIDRKKIKSRFIIFKSQVKADNLDWIALFLILIFIGLLINNLAEWYVSGGMDAGNYVNIAYKFKNLGTFFPKLTFDSENYKCISGFTCEQNRLNPLYLHVYPILLSIGLLISTNKGILFMQMGIAGSTLLAFYLLIKTIINKETALISLILLCLSPLQILYSKEIMSEVISQFFLFTGIIFTFKGISWHRQRYITVAGLAFSVLLLTKLDSIIILLPLFCLISYELVNKAKFITLKFAFIPFLFVAFYYHCFAHSYVNKSYWENINFPVTTLLVLFIPTYAYFVGIIKNTKLVKKYYFPSIPNKYFRMILLLISISILLFLITRSQDLLRNPELINKQNFERINFIRLMYFTSIPAIVLGLSGYILFLHKESLKKVMFVFLLSLLLFLNLFSSMHSSPLYWWGRRYIPFAIPLIISMSAYIIVKVFSNKSLIFKTLSFLTLVILITHLNRYYSPAFDYSQNKGINKQIYSYANIFPNSSILIANDNWHHDLIGSSISSVFNLDTRLYKDGVASTQIIETIKKINGQNIFWLDPNENEINELLGAGYSTENCFDTKFSYSYYYSDTILCRNYDGLFCNWAEGLDIFKNSFSINTCEIHLT